jgi:Fe-S-cluster containining protein
MTRYNRPSPNKPQTGCRRCGACCIKGGPALHRKDRPLVTQGVIGLRFLYTLREGELAMDNVAGGLCPVSDDIIKIKGQGHGWTCVFFDAAVKGCQIYASRPAECRVNAQARGPCYWKYWAMKGVSRRSSGSSWRRILRKKASLAP